MDININEINTVLGKDGKVVIDVRETDELRETGFLPGAVHYPLSTFNLDELTLDKSKEYYLVCKSGGRSKRVQDHMILHGYNANNIEGGMSEYQGVRSYF